jgi:hypothetical protein
LGALSASGVAAKGRAAPADLTGVWADGWYTKLERPKDFKGLVATPAEAEAYEGPRRKMHGEVASKADDIGQNESEFPDNGPGLARIDGQPRSSWIVEPADGKIPWTAAAKTRLHIGEKPPEVFAWFDNPEQRDTEERCLTAPGVGPPIVNSHDGNVLEIVQAPGWLAILGEKNHDLRIVELPGAGAPAPIVPADWHGRSIGRWDGATLVVETQGFRPGVTKVRDGFFLTGRARVSERLTRTGPGELRYDYRVEDPELFTQAWRAEMVFRKAEGRLFEYACHEGNYGLPDLLLAARRAEAASR